MVPPPNCPLEQKQSAAAQPWRNVRGIGLVVSGLVALLLLAYWRAIFGGETFVLHDHLIYTLPSRAHLIDALSHGRLPQWWGAIGLGAPFAANPNHCALYPPAWLAALFPASVGADVVLLLHLFWLGLGGALLARRFGAGPGGALLAGGALATSGFATSVAVNSLPPITFAWTPWLAWSACGLAAATDRGSAWRKTAVVATCAAMQILSGEPAGAITSVLLSAFVTLLQAPRRALALARFAGALCFALLLACLALIPAVELLRQTTRAAGLATAKAGVWSLHPLRLLEFFWPRILGDPGDPVLHAARAASLCQLSDSDEPSSATVISYARATREHSAFSRPMRCQSVSRLRRCPVPIAVASRPRPSSIFLSKRSCMAASLSRRSADRHRMKVSLLPSGAGTSFTSIPSRTVCQLPSSSADSTLRSMTRGVPTRYAPLCARKASRFFSLATPRSKTQTREAFPYSASIFAVAWSVLQGLS